ncbi:endonuclease/exonuclease/phosphatase family protein [Trifolium pratense]|uniref:Endonuclease/exonuclease/phosphatase family protein n=1 Tax=Trifolium pratense TaxID=57577 RepID=A0A2K3PD04_TRIPR|nr:endonuclease/exonuclease/phosphatase family protein [Trifolium pratense]
MDLSRRIFDAITPVMSLADTENADMQQVDDSAVDKENVDMVPETQPTIEVILNWYWHSLHVDKFCVNSRPNKDPNLWGLWNGSSSFTPIFSSDQCIVFEALSQTVKVYIAVVYANASYLIRRLLWDTLTQLQAQYGGPWIFLGDFNAVFGAHEKRGKRHAWLSHWQSVHCCALLKHCSYHHPLLLAIDEIIRLQEAIDSNGITDELRRLDYNAQLVLTKALLGQDQFWKEKARVHHFIHGDRNTSYFHRLAKIKAATKSIRLINNDNGALMNDADLEQHILHYFQNIFC